MRKSNKRFRIGKKICLPKMRKQNLLQAKNESQKNKSNLILWNINEEIQEMQILDQNLHNILLQKQAFKWNCLKQNLL